MQKGILLMYTGPMASGKSEKLIISAKIAMLAKRNILLCAYSFDKQQPSYIASRSFGDDKLQAIPITTGTDLLEAALARPDCESIFIDEIQFAHYDLVRAVQLLLKKGMVIEAAGLDMDFRGEPFGECMPALLSIAYKVYKMTARCSKCGCQNATMSQRLVNGQPADKDAPLIALKEELKPEITYEPRCRECFLFKS